MRNPADPVQVGYYDTYNPTGCAHGGPGTEAAGALWRLDVRNADGLIVIGEMQVDSGPSRWTASTAGTAMTGACRTPRAPRIGTMDRMEHRSRESELN